MAAEKRKRRPGKAASPGENYSESDTAIVHGFCEACGALLVESTRFYARVTQDRNGFICLECLIGYQVLAALLGAERARVWLLRAMGGDRP